MNDSIRFRSDFTVLLDEDCTCGSDSTVARGAWVVPPGSRDGRDHADGRKPVLKACMKGGHNTPFERGLMSVYVEAPGVVWWQLTRQRFMSLDAEDLSLSMESGRYRHLGPEFYVPPDERPCREPDSFKPMKPLLEQDEDASFFARTAIRFSAEYAVKQYEEAIKAGVAREVARLCLPNWALYCDGYVTARPLSFLQFFSKRKRAPETEVATFPQWEIERVCGQMEDTFAGLWPGVYAEFVANGRRAP